MFIRDVGASLLRRWYLTLLGLAATVGLCVSVFQIVPSTYEMKASVVLLPPKTSVEPGSNPYLQLGGLTTVVDVVTRAVTSQQGTEAVRKSAPAAAFTVEADATSSGPIMVITVEDSSSRGAESALQTVIAQIKPTLTKLQEPLDIAADSQVTSMVLTRDINPTVVGKTRLRIAIAAAGAGIVGTTLLVALVDGLLARRRYRKTTNVVSSDGELSTPDSSGNIESGGRRRSRSRRSNESEGKKDSPSSHHLNSESEPSAPGGPNSDGTSTEIDINLPTAQANFR